MTATARKATFNASDQRRRSLLAKVRQTDRLTKPKRNWNVA